MSKIQVPSLFLVIAVLVFLVGTAAARQINWRSITGKENVTSEGSALTSGFVFELGCFDSGFTPTALNTSDWASHWASIDRTPYRESDAAFSTAYVVSSGLPPTTAGKKAYIWGYNTDGIADEWILVRKSNWTWPSPSASSLPLTWVITSSSLDVVVGAVGASGESTYITTARVNGSSPVILPTEWLQQYFSTSDSLDPSVSGWEGDPDHDGLSNEIEYALGMDPTVATFFEDHLMFEWLDSNRIKVTLMRDNSRPAEVGIEYSNNLSLWTGQGSLNAGGYVKDDLNSQVLERDVTNVERHFYRVQLRWLVTLP